MSIPENQSLPGGLRIARTGESGQRVPLYLAGPSSEVERVERIAAVLERTGLFSIEGAWWPDSKDWAGNDGLLTYAEQQRRALACFDAIDRSEIFYALFQSYSQRSSVEGELGYALNVSKRRALFTIVTGVDCHNSILTSLARFRDPQDAQGISAACRYARELQAEAAIDHSTRIGALR